MENDKINTKGVVKNYPGSTLKIIAIVTMFIDHLGAGILESYRLHESVFNSGLDIVVVARASASEVGYFEIESALLHLAKLHQIIKVYFYSEQ